MRRMKQMMVGTAAIVLTGAAIFAGGTTCLATGNTYDTAVEAAYGDTFKSVYNEKLAGSPLEAEAADGVDTTNGHLILTRTDLSLDGPGGMDFELNRYYDSNEAIIGNPTVEAVDELLIDTVEVHYTTHDGKEKMIVVNTALLNKHKKALKDMMISYTIGDVHRKNETAENTQRTKILSNEDFNVYGLASGWKFDLPWIETITIEEEKEDSWSAIPAYLHFGSIGTIGIETTADKTNKCYTITGLTGYSYEDVKLEDWDKEVDGIQCKYLLRDKTGLRTYFNKDGVVVLQKDAHNNTITYKYTDKIYLKEITDSVGRVIRFHYQEGDELQQLTSVTVEGEKVSGGVSKKTVKYTYDERNYTPLNSDTISGLVLKSATVDGSKETYGYRIVERLMSTSGYGIASQRVSTNESYLLNKVTADGNIQHYEYRANAIRGVKDESADQERDVVVQGYYVTREYSEDEKTGKKSDGLKYDFFQKKKNDLIRFCDFQEDKDEIWQYGRAGLRTVAVVSNFNPNKYKPNGKMSDYTYKTSAIDEDTLRLQKDTKKDVSVYIYNSQKMLTDEITYGKEKEETLYEYDKGGKGSLVVLETNKSYGSKGSGVVTTRQGYTYDKYRNVLTKKQPAAYLKKNSGKEKLYTTTYTYEGTGYPSEDTPFSLCTLVTQEQYTSATTKTKLVHTIAKNGIDYSSVSNQRSVNGGAYKTISKTDYQYDSAGNEIQGKVYPFYSTDKEKEVIQNDYTYNNLGQQTKKTVTLVSAKNPADNRTYTEEEVTYDSFGNELTHTDERGLSTKTSYNPETGEEAENTSAVGTEYESTDKEYISSDDLKTMTVDEYGRVSIDIQDGLGNTIISKDETAGTWTESIYDYGSEDGESIEEDTDLEMEETARLLEERTYTFNPDEKRFIINENGETVPNYYISGKGNEILSGTKYFYDNLGNEIGSATFSNGELDAAHCVSWSFIKNETEMTGQEDDAQTISISYSKELNPSAYQPEVDADNYYNQFNDSVLSESITKTVTDVEGNTVSQTSTVIRGKNRSETVTTYETDSFGKTIKKNAVTKKYQDGKWLPAYETEVLYSYDESGNVSQTETKSRKEGESTWQSQVTKTDYDDQGNAIKEYTPRGAKENVATVYTYDIMGRKIQSEVPQEKKDGSISYQTVTTEYDTSGNVIVEEEKIDNDRTAKTEYTYDKRGSLVMVKSYREEEAAQYVQYVYDIQGNKVRQFIGMTSPLTLTVSEVSSDSNTSDADIFTYAGKKYQIEVSGQKKSDVISETKYEYNGKNELVAFIDPEGRKENYTYDVNGNLIKTVDKNRNTLKNTYDYQNRLIEAVAKEKKTGKETVHTYTYNAYGNVATQDDTSFEYEDVSGQVTKETTKLTKNKNAVKNYTYDSANNKSAFTVEVGDDTTLSLTYQYDGAFRLSSVTDKDGNKVVSYGYDIDGNLAERNVAGADLTTTYAYDYQNHLTALKNQTGSAGVLSEYQSEYLTNGQKSKETATTLNKEGKKETKTATYTYDLLGRITKETKTGSEDITYTYDSHNNRKEMTVGNKVTSYKYNKNDELLRTDTLDTETEKDSVVIYKDDKNGNQLATVNRYEIPSGQTEETYIDVDVTLGDNQLNDNVVNHYNALNQLTRTLTKDYKVSFTYDAEGLRTSKTVNGKTTIYVWDGAQIVMELSESGKVQKRYVRGNDLVYADKGEGTEKEYYVTNPHGDVVQLTDESGNVIKNYEYDSFGNEVNPEKKDENPFRYCGEYYDKEIEEIYLRARYYAPGLGRFLTRDTYTGEKNNLLSLHLYTYCENDGVNEIDPSGHMSHKAIVRSEVRGMTKKNFKYQENVEKIVRKVSKKWGKHQYTESEIRESTNKQDVLARAIYGEAANYAGSKKTNRKEIIMIYSVIRNRAKRDQKTVNEIVTDNNQVCAIGNKEALGEISVRNSYNPQWANSKWIRSVVISVLHYSKLYKKAIRFPSEANDNYMYWHSNSDWLNEEKILTYPIDENDGYKKTKVRFLDENGEYTDWVKIKKKIKIDDTWFYDTY